MKANWVRLTAVGFMGALLVLLVIWYQKPEMMHGVRLVSTLPSRLEMSATLNSTLPSDDIESMLRDKKNGLSPAVINKVLKTLSCSKVYHIEYNPILTIIDYSRPSSEKRLWVFDLNKKQLLYHTHVSHGLKSGALVSNYFSNKNNSKASSIGVYRTTQAYYGREGLSLRLQGLDPKFNDNAANRSVVMHGGWYVEEAFIKRYGRAGRSWGCPALPLSQYQGIINTIKNNSLFVVYYPSERWFATSKFLTCNKPHPDQYTVEKEPTHVSIVDGNQESVLFANLTHKNSKLEESAPILAVSANQYEQLFQSKPPLSRMIRRQVNHDEYIALSTSEFEKMVTSGNQAAISQIYFLLPTLKMVHGYYETVMQVVNFGKIKEVSIGASKSTAYVVHFDSHASISLVQTNRFIRWLGL